MKIIIISWLFLQGKIWVHHQGHSIINVGKYGTSKLYQKKIELAHTWCKLFSRRCTSTISARIKRRVTADKRARAARTMAPRLTEEQGSLANSWEAWPMSSPGNKIQSIWKEHRLQTWQNQWAMFDCYKKYLIAADLS